MASAVTQPETQQLVAEENMEENTEPKCAKCNSPMGFEDMAAKKNPWNKDVICKSCHSTLCLLRKHLSVAELQNNMSDEESLQFFQKVLEERRKNKGILSYKILRSTLHSELSIKVTETTKQEAAGTYQPLSWWKEQGYDSEAVRQKGLKMDHEVFGQVYRVDLLTISHSFARERAEATITELEQKIQRKRTKEETKALQHKPKKKAKGAKEAEAKAEPVEELTAEQKAADEALEGVIDLDAESGDEMSVWKSAAKTSAADKRAAKKAENALLKEQQKNHKILSSLAAKALPQLKGPADRLQKLVQALEPKKDHLPAMTVSLYEEKSQKIKELQEQCTKALKDASQGKLVLAESMTLQNERDFKDEMKSLQECLKALTVAKKNLATKA